MPKQRFVWPGFRERVQERLDVTGQRGNLSELARRVRELIRDEKLSPSIVGRWCAKGTSSFPESIERLAAFAEALGTSWQWLLVGDEGAKMLIANAPHEPIVIQMEDRTFQVAKYERTEDGVVSLYRIEHRKVKALSTAITIAKRQP